MSGDGCWRAGEFLTMASENSEKKHMKKKLETKDEVSKKRSGNIDNGSNRGSRESSDHEMHIFTERERRKKMRNMFANLHALLPHLPPKADKSPIIDEAVRYTKRLQQTLQNVQKQKLERLQQAAAISTFGKELPSAVESNPHSAPAANSNSDSRGYHHHELAAGADSKRFPLVFQTWTSSNVVLNICGGDAQISVCAPNNKAVGLFTAICYVLEKHNIEVLSAHLSSDASRCMYMIQAHHAFEVEETYKQAAREIMCWVSS